MVTRTITMVAAGVIAISMSTPALGGTQIPFTLTSPASSGLYVQCVGPWFRRSDCAALGSSARDKWQFYTAEDGLFSAYGKWGCTIHKNSGCFQGQASVTFCLAENDPSKVDLTFDGNSSLTSNAKSSCSSAKVSSTLGHGGEDDPTKARDSDSFDFPGKAGEHVEIVLDHSGAGGSTGEVATLSVLDQSGKGLGQRTGALPLKLKLALSGPIVLRVDRVKGSTVGAAFRGNYSLEVTPESENVGERLLEPHQNVEQ